MKKLLILLFLPLIFGFDYNLNQTFISGNTNTTQPAKNANVTDANFGTTYRRVTNATAENSGDNNMVIPVYSRFSPLNSDGTYLMFQQATGNPDTLIYYAGNHTLMKILPTTTTVDGTPGVTFNTQESSELRWDKSGDHPDWIYYVNQGMKFMCYNLTANTSTTVHNFSVEFPAGYKIMNDVEGDCSDDSRYWAFQVRGNYSGGSFPLRNIITYDKDTDTIVGNLTPAYFGIGGETMPLPNMVEISPNGDRVITHWSRAYTGSTTDGYQNTSMDAPHSWALNFTDPIQVSHDETHSGWAWGLDGKQLFVSQNNGNDMIEAVDVLNGSTVQMVDHADLGWGNGFHFARMPSTCKGWILMSTESNTNEDPGDNQLIMLETKTAGRWWRLGHTHNVHDEYYAEAFAPISQNGDKVWWGAKWPGQSNIDTYELDLPAGWANELNGVEEEPPASSHSPITGRMTFTGRGSAQ